MPAGSRPRRWWSLLLAAATVAVVGSRGFDAAPSLAAEEPTGTGLDTFVGELEQSWPAYADPQEATAHADEGRLT